MSDESPDSTPASTPGGGVPHGKPADAGAGSEARSGAARRRSGRRRGRGRATGSPEAANAGSQAGDQNGGADTKAPQRGRHDRDQPRRDQQGRTPQRKGGRKKSGGDPHRPVSKSSLEAAARAREAVTLAPIVYPEQLPVSASREEISNAIRDHQVVIVAGETGSGKTTQLPKIVLDLGRGRAGQIGHTQPRRIAARTVAERIAEELGTSIGEIVGYQVRFTDESSERTLVKVMTDGILLAQIQRDPELLAYDTLIIDEAHERSLNIDFLLGYLTNLLPRRPDLKVIITSATIDSDRFARHFAPGGPLPPPTLGEAEEPAGASADDHPTAPVIEVTGRTYPVEIRYSPLEGATRGEERDLVTGIVDACDELMREGPGDILVFLSGEREIRDAADALAGSLGPRARDPRHPQAVEIIPLYSRLSSAEQHKVFERHGSRRIVLATNVAETSLTVPGIHYVVDPGTARISRYSKATKVQRLPIEPVSQASANQRAGRAGRLADGIAIRLYAEEDFEGRPEFTEPEILRTSLASVLLQMISVGVVTGPEDMARFPFVEPPDTRSIRDGVQLLTELGALDADRDGRTRLTPIGRKLSRLPMDPRQARMIVEAQRDGVAREVAIIAAGLSIQDPRERPSEEREKADQLHRRFAEPGSDLLSYLNLWEYVREQRHTLSSSAFRRLCRAEHLNFLRVREWQDVVEQIRQTAKPLGIDMARKDAKPLTPPSEAGEDGKPSSDSQSHRYVWNADAIHRSILAGLLSQLGMQETGEPKASQFAHLRGGAREAAIRRAKKQSRNDYLGARGARFAIFPRSPLSKKPPAFVMAAELVETSRLWARDVAAIKPEWAEELAGDLAKRTYADPHWSKKRGAAVATEKVLLYGMPIVADRTILWGSIQPTEARDLFLRHALVQGEWETHHSFWADNQRLLAEAEELEARSRTRGLLADEDALFDFYDERVPESVVSARHFDRWWKDARRENPDLLSLTLDTVAPEHEGVDTASFPTVWPQGDLELPLTYQFEPGTDADGVTVHIPIAVLPRVTPQGFDWMVPGLADELATATIRALPKTVRRLLVPAPDTAREVAAWMARETPAWEDMARAGDMAESYRDSFTRAVRDTRGVDVPADAWDGLDERLPAHLRVTFQVEDEGGAVVDQSTDLVRLQRSLAPQSQDAVRVAVQRTAVQRAADAGAQSSSQDSGAEGAGQAPPGPRIGAMDRPSAPALPEQSGLTTWPELPDGALPDEVSGEVGGATVRGYPALIDEGQAALRVLADSSAREAAHATGVRRLLATECALPTKRVSTRWTAQLALTLGSSPYRSTEALVAALQDAAVRSLTSGPEVEAATVKDAQGYGRARDHVRSRLEDETHRIAGIAAGALDAYRDLDAALSAATSMALLAVVADIRAQTSALVGDGFLTRTPVDRLPHLQRYVKAALLRLEKAQGDPNRDAATIWKVREVANEVTSVREAYDNARPDPARAERLAHARWMLEELRVSLFAQQLGTSEPVSEKRIRALLA